MHWEGELIMRINELFVLLGAADIKHSMRVRTQNIVRKIVVGRGGLNLCNDVQSLFTSRKKVAAYFAFPLSYLDVVWELPAVRAYLDSCIVFSSDADTDVDDGTDADTDAGSDTKETRDIDIASTSDIERIHLDGLLKTTVQDISINMMALRRSYNRMGSLLIFMHVLIAGTTIATIMCLTTARVPEARYMDFDSIKSLGRSFLMRVSYFTGYVPRL